MSSSLYRLLRSIKRRVSTNGYARPVHDFLTSVTTHKQDHLGLLDGEYVINLSFDFELSFNAYFWNGEFERAYAYGTRARAHFPEILSLLKQRHIPHNVQVVGLLFDEQVAGSPLMSSAEREAIITHPTLFSLDDTDIACITNLYTEVGIHGYSHRLFSELTPEAARNEIVHAVDATRARMHTSDVPLFMSFPRNDVAHTDLLNPSMVYGWRARSQAPADTREVPLGLWFSDSSLDPAHLKRVLMHIKSERKSYFLHLWNHFTEMTPNQFAACVEVIHSCGWEFRSVRSLEHNA